MTEKVGYIKNPLTIIAIFAGIAEVSGTIVLPFVNAVNQSIFIWFLILFPTLLVVVFFLTLNMNNKVLYAPSDYKNEENYLKIFKYDVSSQRNIEIEVNSKDTYKYLLNQIQQNNEVLNSKILGIEKLIVGTINKEEKIDSKLLDIIMSAPFKNQIMKFENVDNFIKMMKEKGYEIEIYDSKLEGMPQFEENKSIWLGANIPLSIAKEMIKESKKYFPHLQYIYITGDKKETAPSYVNDTLFIGGATITAKKYGLQPMSHNDFIMLERQTTIQEYHSFIRNFYQ
jgi:hypothetical protein